MVGLSLDQIELVRTAGLVHDVGYLDVDDAIFAKGEQPTDAEWDELASHAQRGARILARCGFGEIAEWVRHHHERIDGGGYPDGIGGDAIPLEARILHVADAYEAMTRGRSYQTRMTGEQALADSASRGRSSTRAASRRCSTRPRRRRPPDLVVDRDVPGLGRDARDPGADRGVAPEVEPALLGHVRIAEERDVGDRHAIAHEVMAILAEMVLERRERLVSTRAQRGQPVGVLLGPTRVLGEEARDGDVRLEVVLLEEEPLEHLRRLVRVIRNEAGLPLPRYQMIAPDSPSGRPSSSTSVGTRKAGLRPPMISGRLSGR